MTVTAVTNIEANIVRQKQLTEQALRDAYNSGRSDERKQIMEIMDSADDGYQAVTLLGKYLMAQQLGELNKEG